MLAAGDFTAPCNSSYPIVRRSITGSGTYVCTCVSQVKAVPSWCESFISIGHVGDEQSENLHGLTIILPISS